MWLVHRTIPFNGTSPLSAVPAGAFVLTYAMAVIAFVRKNLPTFRKKRQAVLPMAARAPGPTLQLILVVVAMVVLAASWLALLGGVAAYVLKERSDPKPEVGLWWATLILLIAIVFLGTFVDQTTLSIHPFYRRRVASAFAVRRVLRGDRAVVAEAYPEGERTKLSKYGRAAEPQRTPHFVFAASATIGQDRTAPGDRRASFTFDSDWVGGPEMGYVRSHVLEDSVGRRIRRDLTVQGAVALSGAAIAASVGGQGSRWYESLYVLTGVHLGAWMPNPSYVLGQFRHGASILEPQVPRVRRLNYLLRELIGVHSADQPLLQVTDGGFYDNLGLIELFRRGCTRIYCVDASGELGPAASTLAATLARAYEELGVVTELNTDTWLTSTAGGGLPLEPAAPLAGLSARLAQHGIVQGTFQYPSCSPYTDQRHGKAVGRSGRLVVARASLWAEMPYELLAYAEGAGSFPVETTANQFFDDKQYRAYTALGRLLGDAASTAMETSGRPAH